MPRIGTWSTPTAQVEEANRALGEAPFLYRGGGPPFHYDGETVTLILFREKAWESGPPDDAYRMESRWLGEDLHWRSTVGTWTYLATWNGDHYEQRSEPVSYRDRTFEGVLWRFERVDPATAGDVERRIAEPTGRWDYRRGRAGKVERAPGPPLACVEGAARAGGERGGPPRPP